MKHKLTLLLALSLIMQCVAAIVAGAVTENSWQISYMGNANTDRTKWYAEITYDYKFSGNAALSVKYPGTTRDETLYCELKNKINNSMSDGRYVLSFCNKGIASAYTDIVVGDRIFKYSDMTKESVAAPSGETNWFKYSVAFDYTAQEENFVAFRFYGTRQTVIDDVVLTMDGDENNLISDPSFEEYEETDDETEYDTTEYQLTNFCAAPANEAMVLSWVNPASAELQEVKIYDITDGEQKLVADNIDSTPSNTVVYAVEGLTNGQKYVYEIVFSYQTKSDYVYIAGGVPAVKKARDYGAWSLAKGTGDIGICPGETTIDGNVVHGGNASLKYVSNIDRSKEEFQQYIYLNTMNAIGMSKNKKYRFGFWVKGDNVRRDPQIHVGFVTFDGQAHGHPELAGTYDWKYVEYDYTYDRQNILWMILDGEADALWYDDITCYELDENGEPTGENLLRNGDFEGLVSTDTSQIKNLTATAGSGTVTLKWDIPNDNYSGANIYQLVFGEYEFRGRVDSNISEITLSGLSKDKEYTYKVVPVNNCNLEGEGASATVTTLFPDYEFGTAILLRDDTQETKVNGAGTYSVSLPVKNNLLSEGFAYEQLVGVYKDGILVNVYSTKETVQKSSKKAEPKKVVTSFTIPDDESYEVEFFVIDSRDKLNVLHSCTSFK